MPKIRQNEAEYRQKDFLAAIRAGQAKADVMTTSGLSEASSIPYATIYKRLRDPDKLTAEEIRKLTGAIEIDPVALLKFLGYSSKDIKRALTSEGAA
ncbi:MAG: hypothetical protein E7439_03490 [Ruminococcaceae bacterium]|nr:hypothetical protein [Oscillospiraceae bacterium]